MTATMLCDRCYSADRVESTTLNLPTTNAAVLGLCDNCRATADAWVEKLEATGQSGALSSGMKQYDCILERTVTGTRTVTVTAANSEQARKLAEGGDFEETGDDWDEDSENTVVISVEASTHASTGKRA